MSSHVWSMFKKEGTEAVCRCGSRLALGKSGTTSHLSLHLKFATHQKNIKKIEEIPAKKPKMEKLTEVFHPAYVQHKTEELTTDVMNFIVAHNLPFSIAESPYLKRLIVSNHGRAQIPTRHDIRAEVPRRAAITLSSLQTFLENQQVSITLDEFSHKEHSLFCITGSFLTVDFKFRSRVLAVESFTEKHTGENIANLINQVFEKLGVPKGNIIAATRDGAPNLAGDKGGGCTRANIESFHCFCHMLHLVFRDAVNLTADVSRLADKSSKIANGFHRTPTATAEFRKVPTARLPIRDANSTRLLNFLLNDGYMSNFDKLRRAQRFDRTKLTSVTEMFIGQLTQQEIFEIGADEDMAVISKRAQRLMCERLVNLLR